MTKDADGWTMARAWRVAATRLDGREREDLCDIWLASRYGATGAARLIGRRFGADCRAEGEAVRCGPDHDARFAGYRAVPLAVGDCGHAGRWLRPPAEESDDPLLWALHWVIGSDTTCRCGIDATLAISPETDVPPADRHPAVHDRWEFGVPITPGMARAVAAGCIPTVAPRIVRIDDRLFTPRGGHDKRAIGMSVRDEIARRFAREWGSVPPPLSPTSLLAIRDGRAVALAVLEVKPWWFWADDRPASGSQAGLYETPCLSISVIWTAHAWRGEGIGRELVQAASTIKPELPLAFSYPFSLGGLELARSVIGSDHIRLTQ